jgi:hypothetical protein
MSDNVLQGGVVVLESEHATLRQNVFGNGARLQVGDNGYTPRKVITADNTFQTGPVSPGALPSPAAPPRPPAGPPSSPGSPTPSPPPVAAWNLALAWDYPQHLHPQTQYELHMITTAQGRAVAEDRRVVPLPTSQCPDEAETEGWMTVCARACLAPGDYSLTVRARQAGAWSVYSNVLDLDFTPETRCVSQPDVSGTVTPAQPNETLKPGAVAGGVAVVGGAAAASSRSLSLPALINPACVHWKILGPCLCNPWTPCVRIEYFEPGWLVEVVKRPGTSALPVLSSILQAALSATGIPALGGGGAGNTGGAGHTNLHFSDVHVWTFPQLWPSPCTACAPVNALPVLHYASEMDAASWRTATAPPLPLPALFPVGVWGPKYPRGGKVIHGSAPIAAALAAVRGMDIVRQPVAPPPYSDAHVVVAPTLTTASCLQMASPRLSPCLPPGVPPPLLETAAVSPNGSYVFVFWKKRTCCIDPTIAACGAPGAVLGGHGANMCEVTSVPVP